MSVFFLKFFATFLLINVTFFFTGISQGVKGNPNSSENTGCCLHIKAAVKLTNDVYVIFYPTINLFLCS